VAFELTREGRGGAAKGVGPGDRAFGHKTPRAVVMAGIVAGLAGGVLMLIWLMLRAELGGAGAGYPLRSIGATFAGPAALVGGTEVVLRGLFLHLAVAIAWGLGFAWSSSPRTRGGGALLMSLLYALGVLLVMTWLVLPAVNPTLNARLPILLVDWIAAHALYGVALAMTPWLLRTLAAAPQPEDETRGRGTRAAELRTSP
jgi:hypothetical protein